MMKYDCPQMMELLVDYLDDELDDDQRDHLEMHLALCPPCMAFLDTYKSTGKVCKQVLEHKMPSEMKSTLSDFLKKSCSKKSSDPEG